MIRHIYNRARLFILNARQEEAECEIRRAELLKQDAEKIIERQSELLTSLAIQKAQQARSLQVKVPA